MLNETLINEQSSTVTQQVTSILAEHRRLAGEPAQEDLSIQVLEARVQHFAEQELPIHMVLPAFPCKSVSRRKVLGVLPDKAEELSLTFLDGICRSVNQVHKPGAVITICSDGRVFGPVVKVTDEAIDGYSEALQRMIRGLGLTCLRLFHLEDVFSGTPDSLREQLLSKYSKPMELLEEEIRHDESLRSTYLGITKFMFEEGKYWNDSHGIEESNTKLQRDSKCRAKEILQRSQAWSALTDQTFPTAVRLSIHPQSRSSTKFGIRLMDTTDNFLTPWHGVAVQRGDDFRLMRRQEADSLNAQTVFRDGRPDYLLEDVAT